MTNTMSDFSAWVAKAGEALGSFYPNAGPYPLHEPDFGTEETNLVNHAITSGWVSSVGPEVDQFEAELATICGQKHAVAMANGTVALQMALWGAGVRAGDEVLMPALTFVATANSATHLGAIPHFVDSNLPGFGIDLDRLEIYLDKSLTRRVADVPLNKASGARVAALVVVHIFGHIIDMKRLQGICQGYGLPLVEDAAESLGSTWNGQPAGSFGCVASLSFNGNKIVTTGGGGAIVTNDQDMAKRIRHMATTARVQEGFEFVHDAAGFNFRMPNLNAALGLAQLRRLPKFVEAKRKLERAYREFFVQSRLGIALPDPPAGSLGNQWLVTALIDPEFSPARDLLLAALQAKQIQARPIWRLMHLLPMYQNHPRDQLFGATQLAQQAVSLPSGYKVAQMFTDK